MSVSAEIDLLREVEQFIYREARFADDHDYDAWEALWTDDAIYWVPLVPDQEDGHHHMSIIYDDRNRLQDRVDRLKSGAAWAQDPKSRMRRLISNIEIGPTADNGDIEVYSNFVLGELRRGLQTVYFAGQIHRLRPDRDGFRLAFKKVMLINNNDPIHNLSFLI